MTRSGPGRSGGCRTCRRRRIKCDETHPTCQRCKQAGHECEGYMQSYRFVDEGARVKVRVGKIEKLQVPRQTSNAGPSISTLDNEKNDDTVERRSENLLRCGPEMSLYAFSETIQTTFLLTHLFADFPLPSTPWLRDHAHDLSPVAKASTLALSTIYFGRIHHQPSLLIRATRLYISALQHLSTALLEGPQVLTSRSSTAVLKSAAVLELFEFFAFNSTAGWMKHAGGIGKLIELRGPRGFQNPDDRNILEGNRVTIALECLTKRKRCFLSLPEWKVVPWANELQDRTMMLFLQDQLCDVPGLMEDYVSLQGCDTKLPETTTKYDTLAQKILDAFRELFSWRFRWNDKNPDPCIELSTSSTEEKPLFPTVLYFRTLAIASEITMFNALLLLLIRLAALMRIQTQKLQLLELSTTAIHSYSSSSSSSLLRAFQTPLLFQNLVPHPREVAIQICRSVEYHLINENSSAGAFFLLFPLRLAHQCFEKDDKVSLWLETVMGRIADTTGFEIARNLSSEGVVDGDSKK